VPGTAQPSGFPPHAPDPRHASHLAALREAVRTEAEDRPGVYRMESGDGTILYVGKSVRVRTRLLSYFRAPPGDKAAELIRETTRIRWDPIPNEFAALLHEMRLIQRHQPDFNVEHRRRRRYGFVRITRERAPRVLLANRVVEDGSSWYGPFPQLRRVGDTIRELVHHLGLRDCPGSTPVHFDDQLELLEAGRTPLCIRSELGSCLAPCAARCAERTYHARAEVARRFLEGRSLEPLRELEERMRQAAGRAEFEYAALLRDRLHRLTRLRDDLLAFRGRVKGLSFVYRVPGWRGDDHLYLIRGGRVLGDLPRPRSAGARRAAVRRMEEWLAEPDRGAGDLTPEEGAEILLVARWFRLRPEERRRTVDTRVWITEAAAAPLSDPGPGTGARSRGARRVPNRASSGPAARRGTGTSTHEGGVP
jgi:excinuclease ABC subunit C